MNSLRNQRVVLTGASAGIGEALALAMAREGARLALGARSEDALRDLAARCEALGGEALAVPTDVTDPDQCRALIDAAVARWGGVDILVNNAGVSMVTPFREVTDLGLFERLMRVNYLGAVYCTHHALKHLEASRGLVVAVSSLTGKTGVPFRTGYAASKHAMQGFFDSLRIELADTGVDVCVISPGFVATDIRARALGADGRPVGASPREESGGETMPLDVCVAQMMTAIRRRDRELVMTARAKLGLWIKLVAPSVVDKIAAYTARPKG